MNTERESHVPGILWSVLTNKCPHCRQGNLFASGNPYKLKTTMRMPEHCPVCGQSFELQTGFYFGTGFVNYGISTMLLGLIFILWALTIGLSYKDDSIFWCLGTGTAALVIIQPALQRLGRSIWITFFVRYDKNWQQHKSLQEG